MLIDHRRVTYLFLGVGVVCLTSILLLSPLTSMLPGYSHPVQSSPSIPIWQDLKLIAGATRLLETNTIVPTYLWHLGDDVNALADEFRKMWVFSAYVDQRSTLAGGPPEISIISSSSRELDLGVDVHYANLPLFCYIAMGKKRGQKESFFRVSSTVTAIPDGHPVNNTLVAALYTCPLADQGELVDWKDRTIYVTLAPEAHPPPHDVFTIVTPTPEFDVKSHREGAGASAVCIQPLVRDAYAVSMRDYISYYQLLGFNQFYIYVLDPGPETLDVLRDLVLDGQDGVSVIRWTLPIAWLTTEGSYLVDPADWGLPYIHSLGAGEEYKHGVPFTEPHQHPKEYVHIADFGQRAAHNDCIFRARIGGARWVATLDWDEYLFLRPPSGRWPPHTSSPSPAVSPITNFARTLVVETKGELPGAMRFRNAFTCVECQPKTLPRKSEALSEFEARHPEVSLLHPTPSIPSVFVSPVRHETWFSKTFRPKSIIDPWAWFDSNIHFPYINYRAYALSRCVDWEKSLHSVKNHEICNFNYGRLWSNETFIMELPSTSRNRSLPSSSSSGALYHNRFSTNITSVVTEWNRFSFNKGLNPLSDAGGSKVLDAVRVPEDRWKERSNKDWLPGPLVEDWTLVETYGDLLADIIDKRNERRTRSWGRWWREGLWKVWLFWSSLMWLMSGVGLVVWELVGKKMEEKPTDGYRLVKTSGDHFEDEGLEP